MLLADDGPRVIDFGISRSMETTMLTQTGMVVGSPGFMSPEQADGKAVGPPSDEVGVTHHADDRIEYDEVIAQLRAELQPDALAGLRSAGRAAPLEEALGRIRNPAPPRSRAEGIG